MSNEVSQISSHRKRRNKKKGNCKTFGVITKRKKANIKSLQKNVPENLKLAGVSLICKEKDKTFLLKITDQYVFYLQNLDISTNNAKADF